MLSVVIPTRDRCATLAGTVSRLLDQERPPEGFEAVVVDNGSTDATSALLSDLAARHPGLVRHVREPRPGPAAARNTGVDHASGDVILFLGDDMAPAGHDLLVKHAGLHARRPEAEYAVLGRAVWSDRQPITPFMRWLEPGYQFGFDRLAAGPVPAAEHLYTAQLSLKRSLFEDVGGFDTRFPYAAVEDIELGMRLADRGLVLDYHPEILVQHDHPTTLSRWLERMRVVGRSAALFEQIHPTRQAPKTVTLPKAARWTCARAAAPIVAPLGVARLPRRLQQLRWRILHHAAYARGYREGPPSPGPGAHLRAPGGEAPRPMKRALSSPDEP